MEKTKMKEPSVPVNTMERCKAVLSVWTEKRKPGVICRELGIKWATFQHWQNRAMEGMLQALEPRMNLAKGEALNPKLLAILEKRLAPQLPQSPLFGKNRLESRLRKIQAAKAAEKPETQNAKA